jgi:hypothetical protein
MESMITILLTTYAVVTMAFVAGLARAARRPMPAVDEAMEMSHEAESKIVALDRAA